MLSAAPDTALAQFTDSFDRPDGTALGNGWIEKSPASFSLAAGAAAKQAVGTGYRDNLAYRPAAEDLLDVEASVELNLTAANPGYPQVLVRLQSASAGGPDSFDGYLLYINDYQGEAVLARNVGGSLTVLSFINLNPQLNTTDTFRLRLGATGVNPVQLDAFVERYTGAAWQIIGQASYQDTSVARIQNAGAVGFSGHRESGYSYDNFQRLDLGLPPNPLPSAAAITPDQASSGGPGFTLTVDGADFVDGAVVRWNGADRTTTFVSASRLDATITAADIAGAGSFDVTVFNPAPGGGASNALSFTVTTDNPVPGIGSFSPTQVVAGDPAFTLSVNGSGFVPGSVVRWDGASRTTTFVSPTQLQADIAAADVADPGSAAVTVFNPAPGGGESTAGNFPIWWPAPAISSIVPSVIAAGSGSPITITVNGSGFDASFSNWFWNGAPNAARFISDSQVEIDVTPAQSASAGVAEIYVDTATPGPIGGASNIATVSIGSGNPLPGNISTTPTGVTAGGPGLTVTVTGSNFTDAAVVRVEGADRTTAFVSSTELRFDLSAADIAAADVLQPQGQPQVTVFNPTPGGGSSNPAVFLVTNPVPSASALTPDTVTAGDPGFTLVINGADFVPGSYVLWDGLQRGATFVSASQLEVAVSAADIASAGSIEVRAETATPGGGTAAPLTLTIAEPSSAWVDDFERANGGALGNGWIEKSPAAFDLFNGTARKLSVGTGYRDNLVYRPPAEDLLELEASVELTLDNLSVGYPQIALRVQSAGAADSFSGYLLYVNGFIGEAALARQNGASLTRLDTLTLSPAMNATDTYRLRLSALGTNPVQLVAYVERFNGTAWDIIAQGSADDASGQRISTAGSIAFGGHSEDGYAFDNYTYTDLDTGGGSTNPLPSVTALVPDRVTEGASAFALTVTGANFVPGSIVRWNGADRATTFVSAGELSAAIAAADVATAGSASVTVFSPAPGGGTSGALTFTIDGAASNPAPSTTDIAPSSATEGGSAFTLTVNGSDFIPSSVVRWNGSDRSTAYNSSGQLTATITAADIASAGSAGVSVFTPAPGGGTSNTQTFTIDPAGGGNPAPTISVLSPSSTVAGSGAFALQISGIDFVPGAVARWNGDTRSTTFLSGSALSVAITAADVANVGSAMVTVSNPEPGGGGSGPLFFSITDAGGGGNPAPTALSINPGSAVSGDPTLLVTVTGYNFTPTSVVRWNGADRGTTYIGSDTLQATIPASDLQNADVATIVVATPGPGGGITVPQPFFVLDSGTTVFYEDFNRLDAPVLDNDWTEKTADSFALINQEARSTNNSIAFRDSIVYRPAVEDTTDVEIGMDIVRLSGNFQFPQLHARVQRDSVTTANVLESYIFYVDDNFIPPTAAIARQAPLAGFNECVLADQVITGGLTVGERYRMRFQVTGANPVFLAAYIEHFNGTDWVSVTTVNTVHDDNTVDPGIYCDPGFMPPPLSMAGAVGFSKWRDRTDHVDNFYRMNISNAIPALSLVTPDLVQAGGADFTLTVDGSNFATDSVVRWNGADRATSFVSANQLTATITAADIATPGSYTVTVFNPAYAGSESNGLAVDVQGDNPVPTLVSLNPTQANEGGADFDLTVTGSGYTATSVVRWNGSDRTTTYLSDTQLRARINAADIAATGTASVSVFNPAPGGGTSGSLNFNIVAGGGNVFSDDFARPDGASIGNGWIEKSPAAFSLAGASAAKQSVASGYRDNVVYRPQGEDLADTEVSLEMDLSNAVFPGYPQIFTRLQSATVAAPGTLDGYILYINDFDSEAVLGRINNGSITRLATLTINPALNTSDLFRLRLATTGSNPVQVNSFVERRNGANWDIVAQGSAADGNAARIQGAGTVGFGGHTDNSFTFDNFTRTDLAP